MVIDKILKYLEARGELPPTRPVASHTGLTRYELVRIGPDLFINLSVIRQRRLAALDKQALTALIDLLGNN